MKVAYAVRDGKLHLNKGLLGQDIVEYRRRQEVVALCVCDGAGSRKLARESAELIANTCVDYLVEISSIESVNKDEFMELIETRVSQYELLYGVSREDMGTTMILFWSDGLDYYLGHVGDGVVIEIGEKGYVVSAPEKGEYHNETFFIPDDNSRDHFREYKGKMKSVNGIIMATDGISDALYDEEGNASTACYKLVDWLVNHDESEYQQILKLNIDNLFDHYNDDDKSIAVITV